MGDPDSPVGGDPIMLAEGLLCKFDNAKKSESKVACLMDDDAYFVKINGDTISMWEGETSDGQAETYSRL